MNERPQYQCSGIDHGEWVSKGEFEWSYMGETFLVNQTDLVKEIDNTVFVGKGQTIINRLVNFHKLFLIIPTFEIIVAHSKNP